MITPDTPARLLPLDSYPATLDEAGRDRLDKQLREQLHTLPQEPGEYLDREGEAWTLDDQGGWTDSSGNRRPRAYAPVLSLAGPFTRRGGPRGQG